jgi:RHS repeat-associated protein
MISPSSNPFRFSTKYTDNETGLLYYGLRYYSPGSGRWLSREPLGEEESFNLYGLISNNPISQIDVLGLYEVDVHRFLSQFLAENAGFGESGEAVGRETQGLDDEGDSRSAMHREKGSVIPMSRENMTNYHFVTPDQLTFLRKAAFSACECRIAGGIDPFRAIGEYLHALEDTYSHSKGRGDRNWKYHGHPRGFGHGSRGHVPDWTWKDIEKADRMAEYVFSELVLLAKECNFNGPTKDWDEIKQSVHEFNSYKPRSYFWEVGPFVRGVSFESYDEKIKKLNPAYGLDPNYENIYKRKKRRSP